MLIVNLKYGTKNILSLGVDICDFDQLLSSIVSTVNRRGVGGGVSVISAAVTAIAAAILGITHVPGTFQNDPIRMQ